MGRIRMIQIGAAHDHAAFVLGSLRRQEDVFDVAGYAVPEDEPPFPAAAGPFEGLPRYSVEQALSIPGLRAAVIETSEKNLTKYARIAAQKGLAVHMDKPGGTDADEYASLMSFLSQRRSVFSTGYMYRFNPAVQKLFEMKDRSALGEIVSVEAQMNCFHDPQKREWLKQYRGGMMFFLGCHLIDLILRLQGEPLQIVPMNLRTGLGGAGGEDFGMALFRYERGWSFAKASAVELGGFMRRQLVVCGTKATVEIDPIEYYGGSGSGELYSDMYVTTAEDCERRGWNARGEKITFGPVDRYDGMMRAFAEAAAGRRSSPADPAYEAKLYRAVLKASGAL